MSTATRTEPRPARMTDGDNMFNARDFTGLDAALQARQLGMA